MLSTDNWNSILSHMLLHKAMFKYLKMLTKFYLSSSFPNMPLPLTFLMLYIYILHTLFNENLYVWKVIILYKWILSSCCLYQKEIIILKRTVVLGKQQYGETIDFQVPSFFLNRITTAVKGMRAFRKLWKYLFALLLWC